MPHPALTTSFLSQVDLSPQETWSDEPPTLRWAPSELSMLPLPGEGPLLGRGGMGDVVRVRDPVLERPVALKVLRDASDGRLGRFVQEARTTAGLSHPGVVPVHALGRLADGRVALAMEEVRGKTLRAVLDELAGGDAVALHRGAGLLRRVAEAVAYAHSRDVCHRDLKPENVMVGDFGTVLVVDWGLAMATGTRPTAVSGTPAYMPREQIRCGPVDARGDIYALGVMLHELLFDARPYPDDAPRRYLEHVLATPPPDVLTRAASLGLPDALAELCASALAHDPAARPADGAAFAEGLAHWMEGARRRERAEALVRRADALTEDVETRRARAAQLRERAARELAGVPLWAPPEEKEAAWALEDLASALESEADLLGVNRVELLSSALTHFELGGAHDRLADTWRAAAEAAERDGDPQAAARHEAKVRHHDRGRLASWLEGTGRLSLDTPARVTLYRYVARQRRLWPERVAEHQGPLRELRLPMGSYLCVLEQQDHEPVRYPVEITRGGHWDGVPPGADEPVPILLPRRGALPPGAVYVPPGWFRVGDPNAFKGIPPARIWCDGRLVKATHVTVTEYVAFLDALVARGEEEEAVRRAPRERSWGIDESVFGRRDDGTWEVRPDHDGDLWLADWPMILVDAHDAEAYAAWRAERDGVPWRLPCELEVEKFARGVDGRGYPWGDGFDPSFCNMERSHEGRRNPSPVGHFPVDESPYGVIDAAGNCRFWCADSYASDGPETPDRRVGPPVRDDGPRAQRGSSWVMSSMSCRVAQRFKNWEVYTAYDVGIRLVADWSP